MNERIEKLADQCQLYDGWFTQQGKIEKFAQLIVLECASLFENVYTDTCPQQKIDKTIKQHFGVE
jgi:hypothetical protein